MEWSPEELEGVEALSGGDGLLSDAEATVALGRALGEGLDDGGFLGLVGPLGAGKTTLVEGLVAAVTGESHRVTSPTYTLVNRYGDRDSEVYHADLYRLEGMAGLESIGYWDYVSDAETPLCVEWLDRIPGAWPGRGAVVELAYRDDARRAEIYTDPSHRDKVAPAAESLGS